MKLKQFINSDSAVSFGYIVIAAFLIGGTAIWIEFTPVFNEMSNYYNQNIADGSVTLQNAQSMSFHHSIISVVPIILLLGLGAWGYIRALEQRNQP